MALGGSKITVGGGVGERGWQWRSSASKGGVVSLSWLRLDLEGQGESRYIEVVKPWEKLTQDWWCLPLGSAT